MPAYSTDRSLQASYLPVRAPVTPFTAGSVGTTSAVLLADLTTRDTCRRIRIVNTHGTQSLALFIVPAGQAAGAEAVTTVGGAPVMAGTEWSFVITGAERVLIVGSGAATTYNGFSSDT